MEMEQSFDEAYEVWFRKHLKESAGDRRLQLERRMSKDIADGEECAETRFLRDVWWPVYGELESLIPEYELVDGLGKTRYLDHAIIRYPVLADLEVDGYASHQKDASRWSFADDRRRDAGLRILGWDVLRIAFSDIHAHPLACQQMLRRWMERYEPVALDREWTEHVVRLGTYQATFTLSDVTRVLRISDHPARKLLRSMIASGVVVPCGTGRTRVHNYRLSGQYLIKNRGKRVYFKD